MTLNILVAEDSLDNFILLQFYLKKFNYNLVHATDGLQAVQKWVEGSFDLLLMDMQMPVMDGLAATLAIRKLEKEQGKEPTPIIAFTAHSRNPEIEEFLKAGCNAYIMKPIDKNLLQESILKYANSKNHSKH